ncbi:NADP-dependent oxidoreductase [Modestobacter versicolor]|uniref:NADP-dependent oxidoreductase n=1 Tax=Modestobacter versicolor TaxID=429133 RepID=UPI0034DF12CD
MSIPTREWQLVRRPHGEPVDADFALVSRERPDPAPGEVAVATIAMSVDPYMRGRMSAAKSYAPSWELGETMQGGAIGQVVDSRSDEVPVGALVLHGLGWRDVAVVPAAHVQVVDPLPGLPLSLYLGVLGMPGLTAWAGLFRLASFAAGDAVLVSGAAGAVGSLVGQFARLRGASRVVGSAGTAEKVDWLRSIGFDAAFDYHAGPLADLLAEAAPEGIDVFFDNVGGEHLEAAIGAFRTHGRAALCGSISAYNATSPPPGPRNLSLVVGKRLSLRGFIVGDHADLRPEFVPAVQGWLRDGSLVARETVVDGLDTAVEAFRSLLSGGNTGKMVVRLAPDPG